MFRSILLTIVLLPFLYLPLQAESSNPGIGSVASLNLLHRGSQSFLILEIIPAKGWHLPWKNAGSTGLLIDWKKLPKDLDGNWTWSSPSRFRLNEKFIIGYDKKLVLVMHSNQPIQENINGQFHWLACKEECISESAFLKVSGLSVKEKVYEDYIDDYLSRTGVFFPKKQPSHWKTSFQEKPNSYILRVSTNGDKYGGKAKTDFFPENEDLEIQKIPTIIELSEGDWSIEVSKKELIQAPLEIISGLVSIDNRTYELNFPKESNYFLLEAILFAFIGGLLLNLMPCVFPVLTMKAMSIIQSTTLNRKDKFKDSIFYSLGIIIFFLALYLILFLIRSTGISLGWGFQLQNPGVVYFLAVIFVLMGFQMFGWIEFSIGVSGGIAKLSERKDHWGSFFSGAIAVLVATPCTAPFMGTALAYAFSEDYIIGLIIFLSLALGMALPIFILTNTSSLSRFIPKPGNWMIRFKEFLSFPLFLTSVWLLWVLSGMIDRNSLFFGIGGIVILIMMLWLFIISNKPIIKSVLLSIMVGLFILIVISFNHSQNKPLSNLSIEKELESPVDNRDNFGFINSIPYSDESLETILSLGEPVFLYFTADWCVSCKYNEDSVFSKPIIENYFQTRRIRVIKADWTNEDERITKRLDTFGRNGVPLYVFYLRGNNSNPKILPQILTENNLIKELTY